MTVTSAPAPTNQQARSAWLPIALTAGILLGALDFELQHVLPYPWANLANSTAMWALAAFALGWWVRGDGRTAAVAGVLLLVPAVESYYLTAALLQHDDLANLTSPTTQLWLVFGVLAGALFGAAGALCRDRSRVRAVVGTALGASVLFAEAGTWVHRFGQHDVAQRADLRATAALLAVIGLVVVAVWSRSWRLGAAALALSIPFAAVGYVLMLRAQFG